MAYESFPNNAHNNRSVTLAEHEQIVAPLGLSGLLSYTGTAPVYADSTGRHVKIRAGVASSILGTRLNNTTETVVGIGANTSGKPRVDLVVLRLRRSESSTGAGDQYTISPAVIQGVPADTPTAPAPVRDSTPGSGFWDVPLAAVTVVNNATTITAAQVAVRAYYISGSGYIGRDDWAKPPTVEPGVIFHAADSGITYVGLAGGSWQAIGDDSGNLTVATQSGYTSTHSRGYRRNRWAFAELTFSRASSMSGTNTLHVATLPVGLRPPFLYQTFAICPSVQSVHACAVHPDGKIYFNPSGVTIPAGRSIVFQSISHPVGG